MNPLPSSIRRTAFAVAAGLLAFGPSSSAQPSEFNYDESKVPRYTLPDPLTFANGAPVRSARDWTRRRRPEVLELFRENVYGRSPGRPKGMTFEVRSIDPHALGGKAVRKEVRVWLGNKPEGLWMDVLLYLPANATGRVPAFLGLNFEGNHAVSGDPGVTLSTRWVPNDPKKGRVDHHATEAARGTESSRWPVTTILARGYALATVYYGDIEPDFAEGWRKAVRATFPVGKPGQPTRSRTLTELHPDDWGAIAAWAWGLSRALDYLETDRAIDARRVAVLGHSRLGKTALWAGAEDQRFALVISNNSGEGGAALARRRFGETTKRINTSFPHWFNANFKKYNDHEDAIPVDQHELLALIAPRPLYVASAEKDQWADPRGEFLAAKAAEPVYELLGKPGLGTVEMPKIDQPVAGTIGYHIRNGVHDVTDYDWAQYLDFADHHLKSRGH